MSFRFFKMTENRGVFLIVLAIVWLFVFGLLYVMSQYPCHYFPFFNTPRYHLAVFLPIGVLGSILASSFSRVLPLSVLPPVF